MSVVRKLLGGSAAILSILCIFLSMGAIGLTLSNYHPSTVFDRIAPWLVIAALIALSFVLMRFASRTLR